MDERNGKMSNNRLRKARERLSLSQEYVAKYLGLTRTAVTGIGKFRAMNLRNFAAYMEFLMIMLWELNLK